MIKNYPQIIVMLLVCLLWAGLAQAQESANTTGGDATGLGGTAAYSIGQVVYTTQNSINGSVAQGVQHAYDVYAIGIEHNELNVAMDVYPNPTSDNIILQIPDFNNQQLWYRLLDAQGKIIVSEKIVAQQSTINMYPLSSATYFLQVVNQENKQAQSFSIIKK
jgi:hypothetical protein